jgi:ethanolamine ammonia-lyase small subunit
MNLPRLRDFTSARVGLHRSGSSLPTSEVLALQLAHAQAREAVYSAIDSQGLGIELTTLHQREFLVVRSRAGDRAAYLKRPDLGRRLNAESRESILARKNRYDAVLVIADGLSALAVQQHAVRLVEALLAVQELSDWDLAPFVIVEQGRVAIGDEIGECLGARLSVVMIGERPGLSSADSLGVYLTWDPRPGRTDADRNCISNIRTEGFSYGLAAEKLAFLMCESRRRGLSGVQLKDNRPVFLP